MSQQPATTFDARRFLLAGDATLTVENSATGNRFTFRVQQPEPTNPHFVKVLTGPDNEADYAFLGTIFDTREYRPGKKSRISADAPSAKAFGWLWGRLSSGAALPDGVNVHHEGRCGACNRKLTVPLSIVTGIGPECAKRLAASGVI